MPDLYIRHYIDIIKAIPLYRTTMGIYTKTHDINLLNNLYLITFFLKDELFDLVYINYYLEYLLTSNNAFNVGVFNITSIY